MARRKRNIIQSHNGQFCIVPTAGQPFSPTFFFSFHSALGERTGYRFTFIPTRIYESLSETRTFLTTVPRGITAQRHVRREFRSTIGPHGAHGLIVHRAKNPRALSHTALVAGDSSSVFLLCFGYVCVYAMFG